jgi:hypothetical protein
MQKYVQRLNYFAKKDYKQNLNGFCGVDDTILPMLPSLKILKKKYFPTHSVTPKQRHNKKTKPNTNIPYLKCKFQTKF